MSNNYNNIGDINKANDSDDNIKSYNDNNKSIINSFNNLSINESNNSNLIASKSTEYSSIIDFENNERIFEYIYDTKKEKIKNSIIILDEGEQNKTIYEKLINNYYNANNKETKDVLNKICFLILENKKLEKLCDDLKLIFKNRKISILQGGKGKKLKNDFDIFMNVFKETDIFVAIPDVFYKLLSIGFIKIYQFSILFLDDCHICEGNHPYNIIMQEFYYYYLYRHFELKINIYYSLPNIIGFSNNQFLYEKIINKDDKSIKFLTNLSEKLNCQIIISKQILSRNEINNYKNFENIEYLKNNNHLNNDNIDVIYKILNHYFINKVLDLILTNHIKQKQQREVIKNNYLDIIKKKFYSKDKEEYLIVKSLQKDINFILNDLFIFEIFENIIKYLIIIFQHFDIELIKELLIKYLTLLQNFLLEKKNEQENFQKIKEEIIFLIGIIKDSIKAFEYLLNNKINYNNDRYIKFISNIESIINNKNAKILIFVSSRKLAFLLNDILNKKKYKSEYIIGPNTKKEKSCQISLLTEMSYKTIEEITEKYNSDEIDILICTSSIYDFIQINKCDYIITFELVSNLISDYIKIKNLAINKKSKLIIFSTNPDEIKNIFKKDISLNQNKSLINLENSEIVKDFRRKNFLEEKIQIIGKNNYYYIEETQAKVSIKNSIMLFNDINNWFITQNKKIIINKFIDEFSIGKIKKYKCKIEIDKTFGDIKIFSHSYGDKQSAEADCYLQLISFFHKFGTIDNNLRIIDS